MGQFHSHTPHSPVRYERSMLTEKINGLRLTYITNRIHQMQTIYFKSFQTSKVLNFSLGLSAYQAFTSSAWCFGMAVSGFTPSALAMDIPRPMSARKK